LTGASSKSGARRRWLPREQWQRNELAVIVAAGMVFLGFTLVTPFLPFYVKSLGVHNPAAIALWSGALLTVSPLIASVLGPVWGRLADRVGMRIMVQRVLVSMALHWGLMYFASNIWQVLGLRILLGIFSGFGTMSIALVTHGCPQDHIGRAVGRLQATQILSTAIGPFLGGILADAFGIRRSFILTFALCVGALLFVVLLYRDTKDAVETDDASLVVTQEGPVTAGVRAFLPRPPERPLSLRQILSLPMYLPLLPMMFLINLVDRSMFLSVPLYLGHLHLGAGGAEAATGVVVSAGALASAASAFILGRSTHRAPPASTLLWCLAIGALAIAPMGFCRTLLPFLLLRIILGLAAGGAPTLGYTIGGGVIPPSVRATAYSILSSAAMLGGSMGPILSGALTSLDVRASFLVGGLIYAALTIQVAILARHPWPVRATAGAPAGPAEPA
jgi:DHA1 family multidrug resistance protein-like MFS transporter